MTESPYQKPPQQGFQNSQALVLQGRYEIIDQLGQGGMGTVYLARDHRLHGRTYVIKKLRDDFFRDEDREKAMAFFMREIEVLCDLKHPNIVDIKDHFPEGNDYFILMEYVEGKNLHEMLHERGEPFAEDQVLEWSVQICKVLNYLHTHDPPVIYRDLKPSNVMIDTLGRVKLVDFGIARQYRDDSDNTHVVSAGYSPPEQYWGAAEPRSDVYALGATMSFLLTGQEPLALQTSSPRKHIDTLSEHIDYIVQRATAQDPWLRFQNALEMLEELEYRPEVKRGLPQGNWIWGGIIGVSVVALAFAILYVGWHSAMMPKQDGQIASTAAKKVDSLQQQLAETRNQNDQVKKQLDILRQHMEDESKKKTDEPQQVAATNPEIGTPTTSSTQLPQVSPVPGAEPHKVKEPDVIFQEDSEAQLTDPEGLAPLEEDSKKSPFGFPIFKSTDNH
ncbi:MAG TPA: serine/threonine protein kinase [Candidatus Melainabacteria bacterium]|nr:serine/threonine protein kinase [Candidatus Melainabacteria bacterium]HIN67481.1 serine/threonine protein kinase [Candidatus Obscuribacterales bacterium]